MNNRTLVRVGQAAAIAVSGLAVALVGAGPVGRAAATGSSNPSGAGLLARARSSALRLRTLHITGTVTTKSLPHAERERDTKLFETDRFTVDAFAR